MVVDALLWALLGLGVTGLIGLVVRKLPVLRVIDTSKLGDVNQGLVKLKLLEQRLRRKLQVVFQRTIQTIRPTRALLGGSLVSLHESLQRLTARLERRLEKHTTPVQTVGDLMVQAETALRLGRYDEAEIKYLAVLRHDAHNLAAYNGLGVVYLATREYEQAREVFEYLVGRGVEPAHLGLARSALGQGQLELARTEYQQALGQDRTVQPLLELARVLQELGDPAEAFVHLREARAIEPRNPKLLDFYIELSIVNEQPIEAQSALDALREVNPENQKITELSQAVRRLTDKLKVKRPGSRSRTTTFGVPVRRKA